MGLRGKTASLTTTHAPCTATRVIVAVCLAALSFVALASTAAAAEVSVPATRTAVTTVTIEGYDVDFTLPSAAKNGCLVCHGDGNLTRLKDGEYVSFYVDPELVERSAHAGVQCTGCHLDFAFTVPHVAAGDDWRAVAKSACKNCHQDQFLDYGRSAHRIEEGDTAVSETSGGKPLCGDCHGSHAIMTITDSPSAQQELRDRAYEVCGECHQDYWDSYDDYYHGAAFKLGAADAPSCWDCHEGHEVLPSSDKDSSTNERHIVETCAQCHAAATEDYTAYTQMIHGRTEIAEDVFLRDWLAWLRGVISSIFGG